MASSVPYPTTFSPPSSSAAVLKPSSSFANPRIGHQSARLRLLRSGGSELGICRCSSSSVPERRGWDAALQEAFRNVVERIGGVLNEVRNWSEEVGDGSVDVGNGEGVGDVDEMGWDWERWMKHFEDVDSQERIVSVLKSQLDAAVVGEEFADAARLKVAIAAASTSDTVGKVMALLERAIIAEQYDKAAFMRDNAGAGLVGWWNGISEDATDPYGRIIRITAEHGRYVATSYSPRQLATSAPGAPLFEIFLTTDKEGKYKQQAVYLKRKVVSQDFMALSSRLPIVSTSGSLKKLGLADDKTDPFGLDGEDTDNRDNDSDVADKVSGFQNIIKDMIPGVRIKVVKVTAPEKIDQDLISKVIEQIMEDEEDEDEEEDEDDDDDEDESSNDSELENIDDGSKVGPNSVKIDIPMEPAIGLIRNEEEASKIAMKFLFGGLAQKISSNVRPKDLLRVPAKLEKKGRTSFCFSIEKENGEQIVDGKGKAVLDQKSKLLGQRSIDNVMLDLSKFMGTEKISVKALKDIGEFINNSINQARNQQPLSGSTTFNRIELPAHTDPLNGLYVGSNGLYSSEVIQLRRKFGQFQEDRSTKEPSNLEFYEYVEALKLTGDPHVPAGQVAFRAKVGKRYQLPHKGIIPQEFGVVARYKGQGRLAEAGFKNPRWVDGELVILDGKFIKGGPAVGFVYWAPEYHFILFFSRLRLQD